MSSIGSVLESRFKLKENKTNIQTEVLAGVTTFATMSYVLATIPNMLEQAGLVRGAILTALICAVVICSVAMALYTNRPFLPGSRYEFRGYPQFCRLYEYDRGGGIWPDFY